MLQDAVDVQTLQKVRNTRVPSSNQTYMAAGFMYLQNLRMLFQLFASSSRESIISKPLLIK